MILNTNSFLDYLFKHQVINKAEASFLEQKFGDISKIVELIVNKKITNYEQISKISAEILNIPFAKLEGREVDLGILSIIPVDLSIKYGLVAFEKAGNEIKVAVARPYLLQSSDIGVAGWLKNIDKGIYRFSIVASTINDVANLIKNYQQKIDAVVLSSQKKDNQNQIITSNLPTMDLSNREIDFETISIFPEEIVRKYQVVVIEKVSDSSLRVGLIDPNDENTQKTLKFIENKNNIFIEQYKITQTDFDRLVRNYHPKIQPTVEEKEIIGKTNTQIRGDEVKYPIKPISKKNDIGPVNISLDEIKTIPSTSPDVLAGKTTINEEDKGLEETNLDKFLGKPVTTVEELSENMKSGQIPKIVASLISFSIIIKASDIHIEPQKDLLRIRFRVEGELREYLKLPISLHPLISSRIKILSGLKIDEQRIPQEGRYDGIANGHEIDIRVSSLPTIHGEKIVMRVLDKDAQNYQLDNLGLNNIDQKRLTNEINKPWGMVLATGPTGSGKTTTLYAVLNKILTPKINVITLEDPVEYQIEGINQVQVKPKIGFSFAEGLRSILRQDPNIIMVGEIRDSETASLATQSALTGHLVLSTLHTNSSSGALPRLVNMGVEPYLITSAVNAIVAQRLIRKLCQDCRVEKVMPDAELEKINEMIKDKVKVDLKTTKFYDKGEGCDKCHDGFFGRVGLYEILVMSDKIEQAIITNKPATEIETIARNEGMITLLQDGIIKVLKGLTSYEEVLKVAMDK